MADMAALSRPAIAALALVLTDAPHAEAQGVDRYQFLQVEERVEALEGEIARLRGAVSSGAEFRRLDGLEAEIARLTDQVERLGYAVRQQEEASKKKLEDLEYRIIELEGGDPSILFQDGEGSEQGALSPSETPAPPQSPSQSGSATPSGGTLGVLTTTARVGGEEKAALDAGVAAVNEGRPEEGARLLERFIRDYPDSAVAGDAYYWLGESRSDMGALQAAANSYLDAATLFPGSPRAAESFLRLGETLRSLGRTDVACSTFRELSQRFPGRTDLIAEAERQARQTGCA